LAYRPFTIEGVALGRVAHDLARRLADYPKVFQVTEGAVTLVPELADFDARSAAVHEVLLGFKEAGLIPKWRGEDYPVIRRWGDTPPMKMERGAVPLFGVRGFGVNLNGYVRRADGLHMWIGKRSKTKLSAPSKRDHMVGGGQPYGLGIKENLIKECEEEAGMTRELAMRAVPVGAISYICTRNGGLRDGVSFNYDLEVPEDFIPRNMDGEVESFELWPMARVMDRIRDTQDFVFDVNLAILDFAIRHGILTPDDPDYQAVWEGLHL
jgi:Domain of unknown function (DUF4743)